MDEKKPSTTIYIAADFSSPRAIDLMRLIAAAQIEINRLQETKAGLLQEFCGFWKFSTEPLEHQIGFGEIAPDKDQRRGSA